MEISDRNVKLENGIKIYNNSSSSKVVSDRKNTILNDVDNIFVISKKESLYISSKKNINSIKEILNDKKFKSISDNQNIFFKPWGHYETFINSPNYLVKKLTIKPKHRLSLQYHNFRTEHWIIVEGIAKITKGNSKKILRKNESTFIPLGVKHCIENIGKVNLEIIEVQMGEILKESDIVRLDDPYKR
jgi:mannose-6-phosphate isomerase-like protein (cupin superfamily)